MKKLYRKVFKIHLFRKKELYNPKLSKNLKPKTQSEKIDDLRNIFKRKSTFAHKISAPKEKFKKGGILRNSLKKAKEKIKDLKIKRTKKYKVISSKKLAILLTATTMIGLLPILHLTPITALAATSTCILTINFIMVKSLKKFLKQRNEPSSNMKDVSVEISKKGRNF